MNRDYDEIIKARFAKIIDPTWTESDTKAYAELYRQYFLRGVKEGILMVVKNMELAGRTNEDIAQVIELIPEEAKDL